MWRWLQRLRPYREITDEEFRTQRDRVLQRAPVPAFWLFGKTGSGKTSLVKFLTGAERAEIGNGFQPQTARSEQYEFPAPDSPLLRFIDTRGLGESRYDPAEDIRKLAATTQLMLVTVRVLDHALSDVVAPLREIRAAVPQRPVVLVLTCLHEAYPGAQHPQPDPFAGGLLPDSIPADLRRSIAAQQERFDGLVDRIVPVDLTRPEEGFAEPNFGGDRLQAALLVLLPAAYRQTLLTLDESLRSLKELNERRAMPYIISHSTLAATAGAVPVPWVDIPAVAAIQSHLVCRLAAIYGQQVRARMVLKMAGPIGGRMLVRLAVRGALKFVPFVGLAANAALAYAYTYGLGKACCWYFGQVCQGNAPSEAELQRVWESQLLQAAQLWRKEPRP
jgi:uncharacterized protein (DUF697 family)/predicted GTPase